MAGKLTHLAASETSAWLDAPPVVDATKVAFYDGISFHMQNADGEDVGIPRVILLLQNFNFVPYSQRKQRPVSILLLWLPPRILPFPTVVWVVGTEVVWQAFLLDCKL